MNSEQLNALLSVAGTDSEGDWSVLKDDRTLTLHASHGGAGLNVAKIRKVRFAGDLIYAENVHGDTFCVLQESVFAGSVDPASKQSRKAGFR